MAADVLAVHVGGPALSAWREDALCRIAETEGLRRRCVAELAARDGGVSAPDSTELAVAEAVDEAVTGHLRAARETASGEGGRTWWRMWTALTGTDAVRTWGNVNAAEVQVLRIASPDVLRGALPGLLVHLRRYLADDDLRRVQVEGMADSDARLDRQLREALASAVSAGYAAQRAARARVIRLRNLVHVTGAILTAVLGALIALAAWRPAALSLCFPYGPGQVACPTGIRSAADLPSGVAVAELAASGDVPVVVLLGVVAAALCAAASARLGRAEVPGTGLSSALLLVKLPWGGLTALLGVLLLRADVLPVAPQTSGQILGVALLCGVLQQLFSRLLDRRAARALADAAGRRPIRGVRMSSRARHAVPEPTDIAALSAR
ncbi:hypothetical protein GCM10010123_04460 [Pilimelia anulata]|uniref:Uncharacterized protein n=1 Tax=Pilimelia anulata TaxID=53371 RepID=A0A8J3B086_9ACTN|nr:hypothetical protein GCM10010123_04460 [Pilimelia anulata]